MTPNDFAYWLQGYVELDGDTPTDQQWEAIKDHLQLVMDKKTPNRSVQQDPAYHLVPSPDYFKITC